MEEVQPRPRAGTNAHLLYTYLTEAEEDTKSDDICSQVTDENWRFGNHFEAKRGSESTCSCRSLIDPLTSDKGSDLEEEPREPTDRRETNLESSHELAWPGLVAGLLWGDATDSQAIWGRCIFRWAGIRGMEFYQKGSSDLPSRQFGDSVIVGQLYHLLTVHFRLRRVKQLIAGLRSDPMSAKQRARFRIRAKTLENNLDFVIINSRRLLSVYTCWLIVNGDVKGR